MTKKIIWRWMINALDRYEQVALLMVVASKGSSPGTAGAKMAVFGDGATFGTVGGGNVELDLSRRALEALKNPQDTLCLLEKHHYDHQSKASGHICGGFQQMVMWICQASDLPVVETILHHEEKAIPAVLTVTPQRLIVEQGAKRILRPTFTLHNERDWLYQEMIGMRKKAFIIGGGHVSLALSQLLALLEFEINVFDQRDDLPTLIENQFAARKTVLPYTQIESVIEEGYGSYVFVMTHSHETDQQVVERLAQKHFRYVGLMGSRRKINILKENLADRIDPIWWETIHAPVGLPINSNTPMEIAVSIAAELIQFDNTEKC